MSDFRAALWPTVFITLFTSMGIARSLGDEESQRSPSKQLVHPSRASGTAPIADDSSSSPVKVGAIPAIKLAPRRPVSQEHVELMKRRIAALAQIESADFGISPTVSGSAFLPLPGHAESSSLLLTDHNLKSSSDLENLVADGPNSLPYLLDALDDKTPTKLIIKHDSSFGGGMTFEASIHVNDVNEYEMKALRASLDQKTPGSDEKAIDSYTVTVGDVCFVAIGQIVGRRYRAVRYQPTAFIVINSPTHDGELCRVVRAIWSSKDSAKRLFDSLLTDYSTEGVFNGQNLHGWYEGHRFETSAAIRLLYYFPDESAGVIAERLRKLDVGTTGDQRKNLQPSERNPDDFMRRCVKNGVRADEFIRAVAWCKQREVREAIQAIFRRTDDIDILLASLPAMGKTDNKLVAERLQVLIDAASKYDHWPYGDAYNLLLAYGERFGNEAPPVFARFLTHASIEQCEAVVNALYKFKEPWSVKILSRLLLDKREMTRSTYRVHPHEEDSPTNFVRVCDNAAEAIHFLRPELTFQLVGDRADLDRQIDAMKKKLAEER
jgi:hypothetical protein